MLRKKTFTTSVISFNLVDKIQNEDYCDGNLDVPRSELAKRSRSGLQAIVVLDPQDEAKLAQAYQ